MQSLSDLDVLALTIWGESRSEPIEGKVAVANVCHNRRQDGRWGPTYERVCLAPWQFSCWTPKGGLQNYTTVKALSEQIMSDRMPADPVLTECYWVAQGMINHALRDNVAHATHYHTVALSPPGWAKGHAAIAHIGGHLFYAGIA